MIDFTTQQLSWIIVGACGIGGTGYLSLNQKVDNINTNVFVTAANEDNMAKQLQQLQQQLNRIEEKLDNQKRTK